MSDVRSTVEAERIGEEVGLPRLLLLGAAEEAAVALERPRGLCAPGTVSLSWIFS